jgi:hypothetical protein
LTGVLAKGDPAILLEVLFDEAFRGDLNGLLTAGLLSLRRLMTGVASMFLITLL